jgi:YegS/Rv2252/BmrU family lipid kinase
MGPFPARFMKAPRSNLHLIATDYLRELTVPRQHHFIVNTLARSCTTARVNHVIRSLEARGIAVEVDSVTAPGEATKCATRICSREKHPVIIVGGGDGTVNGVINGLPFGRATVAVVPLGTANVLAHEVGIRSLDDAVARIATGATRTPAIGLLQADRKKHYFLLMAGVGLDGSICATVRSSEKTVLGKGAYLLAAVRHLASWERERLEIYTEEMRIDCHSVIVCNSRHYGGNVVLAPDADIFTPEFQVVCLKDDRRRSYLRLALNTLAGRYPETTEVRRFITGKLVVTGRKAVQADGDFVTWSPVRISIVEQFFQLIV